MDPIKELLISKVDIHSLEQFTLFHKDVPTTSNSMSWSPYLWGNTSNGFFLYTANRAVFLENDTGKVYRIRQLTSTSLIEYRKHKLLSTLATTRMDMPIHYEEFEIKGRPWVYTIVQRPNKQLGSSYFITCGLAGNDATEFFNRFINEHVNLLTLFPKVVNELGDGLPEYCEAVKYWEDDKGLFATDFKYWSTPSEGFIDNQLATLDRNIIEWNAKFTHAPIDATVLLKTASSLWRSIDGYQ